MKPTVAVIGGGYGGTSVAKALDDVADVVLIERRDRFVHNIGALRGLVSPDWLPQIFLPYDKLLSHGSVIQDRATRVEQNRVTLASGKVIDADYIVLATGSSYPFPAKSDVDDLATALGKYRSVHNAVADAPSVLLLGAGPVGIELAGEITSAWPDKQVTVLDPAEQILTGDYRPELRQSILDQLRERGVRLVLGKSLSTAPPTEPGTLGAFTATTTDGESLSADLWLRCFGVTPVTDYLDEGLAAARTARGLLSVTPELRLSGQETVFVVGDIADTDEPRMGGRAREHGKAVAANITALITGVGELVAYEPAPSFILVPLGPDGGATQLPGQDDIGGPDITSQYKGSDMMVGQFAEDFGLPTGEEG